MADKGKRRAISSATVDALQCPPGADRAFLWDDKIAGFGVAAFPSGKRVYVFQYRHKGRSFRLTLGRHGNITPDKARALAKIKAGQVADGKNPKAEIDAARGVRTFRELGEEYMATHVLTKRKARTGEEYARMLRLQIAPAIGSKRVSDIRRADVARLHHGLAKTPAAANRVLTLIASIWNWAADREEPGLGENPASKIKHYPEKSRERFLTSEEIGRIGDALALAETKGFEWDIDLANPNKAHAANKKVTRTKIDVHAAAAIRLLILTGARLREILSAQWDNVNWERGYLDLPDSKTGRKIIYLPAPALAVLQSVPRVTDNPYIIAGHGPRERKGGDKEKKRATPRSDLKKPWAAIVRAAGFLKAVPVLDDAGKPILDDKGKPVTREAAALRIHDLRHSFASVGAGASLGLPIIGKLLGHRHAATTDRYSHLDADPMRRAVDIIGGQIAASLERRPAAGDLVAIGKRRKRG